MASLKVMKPTTSYGINTMKLVECRNCSRTFAEDRIEKHESICSSVRCTTAPSNNASKRNVPEKSKVKLGTKAKTSETTPRNSCQNNWRQKHEEFIKAIRTAKQVQQHLKNGGRLQDLPPPEASLNPDYIQCPHCSRRFNAAAAERHIPKCVNYEHNKSKQQMTKTSNRPSGTIRAPTPFVRSSGAVTATVGTNMTPRSAQKGVKADSNQTSSTMYRSVLKRNAQKF